MPDLAYILRHPIQEARLTFYPEAKRWARLKRLLIGAWLHRRRMERYFAYQRMAWRLLRLRPEYGGNYADEMRSDILGEDENGDLMGPSRTPELWESWRPWRIRHICAALTSRRLNRIGMLELEPSRAGDS